MRGGLAVVGTGIAAVLCCAPVPLTVGITGLGGLAALGANAGTLVLIASATIVVSIVWTRWHGRCEDSEGKDG